MWPPSSEDSLFARRMIATAFQRIAERILCSSSRFQVGFSSFSGGIVLTYGVVAVNGSCAPVRRASSRSCSRMNRARSTPECCTIARSESTHSWVSTGSWSFRIPIDVLLCPAIGKRRSSGVAQSFGSPCTRNTSSRCGLIGRLSRTPEGSGFRNHLS